MKQYLPFHGGDAAGAQQFHMLRKDHNARTLREITLEETRLPMVLWVMSVDFQLQPLAPSHHLISDKLVGNSPVGPIHVKHYKTRTVCVMVNKMVKKGEQKSDHVDIFLSVNSSNNNNNNHSFRTLGRLHVTPKHSVNSHSNTENEKN